MKDYLLTSFPLTRTPAGLYRAEGMIKNVNTFEEYTIIDKTHIIQQSAKMVRPEFVLCRVLLTCEILDMGCHMRRHRLFKPLVTRLLHHLVVCRPQKVQVPLLVCISCTAFKSFLDNFEGDRAR